MSSESPVFARGATISEDGLYRYRLHRIWDTELPSCCFVMLNPSTADGSEDDPTIRRCIGFARKFGCGRLDVVNLFAFRATDPREMFRAKDAIGPKNREAIADATRSASLVIAAWGVQGTTQSKLVTEFLASLGAKVKCLQKTKHGHPRHPLYMRNDVELLEFP